MMNSIAACGGAGLSLLARSRLHYARGRDFEDGGDYCYCAFSVYLSSDAMLTLTPTSPPETSILSTVTSGEEPDTGAALSLRLLSPRRRSLLPSPVADEEQSYTCTSALLRAESRVPGRNRSTGSTRHLPSRAQVRRGRGTPRSCREREPEFTTVKAAESEGQPFLPGLLLPLRSRSLALTLTDSHPNKALPHIYATKTGGDAATWGSGFVLGPWVPLPCDMQERLLCGVHSPAPKSGRRRREKTQPVIETPLKPVRISDKIWTSESTTALVFANFSDERTALNKSYRECIEGGFFARILRHEHRGRRVRHRPENAQRDPQYGIAGSERRMHDTCKMNSGNQVDPIPSLDNGRTGFESFKSSGMEVGNFRCPYKTLPDQSFPTCSPGEGKPHQALHPTQCQRGLPTLISHRRLCRLLRAPRAVNRNADRLGSNLNNTAVKNEISIPTHSDDQMSAQQTSITEALGGPGHPATLLAKMRRTLPPEIRFFVPGTVGKASSVGDAEERRGPVTNAAACNLSAAELRGGRLREGSIKSRGPADVQSSRGRRGCGTITPRCLRCGGENRCDERGGHGAIEDDNDRSRCAADARVEWAPAPAQRTGKERREFKCGARLRHDIVGVILKSEGARTSRLAGGRAGATKTSKYGCGQQSGSLAWCEGIGVDAARSVQWIRSRRVYLGPRTSVVVEAEGDGRYRTAWGRLGEKKDGQWEEKDEEREETDARRLHITLDSFAIHLHKSMETNAQEAGIGSVESMDGPAAQGAPLGGERRRVPRGTGVHERVWGRVRGRVRVLEGKNDEDAVEMNVGTRVREDAIRVSDEGVDRDASAIKLVSNRSKRDVVDLMRNSGRRGECEQVWASAGELKRPVWRK
ncbi:hypothetical protein B0H12DRAFT_1067155 [Mycena haematopus]|nr:hypothetical protein B0H12DRAFT_1067155 [Mycena haematopus]